MYHVPVLAAECLDYLRVREGGLYFDGTLGGGGHSELILRAAKTSRLIATDKDAEAVQYAGKRLKEFESRLTIVRNDFKNAPEILKDAENLDGVILDLGISSRQIDEAGRGFSYIKDAPLDMRMDTGQAFSALELVNGYAEEDLKQIFFEYGEEKNARRIAAAITKARAEKQIQTTAELAEIISKAAHFDPRAGHPAKKVFQAIRIEVNDELKDLDTAIKYLTGKLKTGGRICVISFHSLEDRIVKNAFRYMEQKCVCPPKMPICRCGKIQEVKILTNKPVTAGSGELKSNSRAASAKLRVAEKI